MRTIIVCSVLLSFSLSTFAMDVSSRVDMSMVQFFIKEMEEQKANKERFEQEARQKQFEQEQYIKNQSNIAFACHRQNIEEGYDADIEDCGQKIKFGSSKATKKPKSGIFCSKEDEVGCKDKKIKRRRLEPKIGEKKMVWSRRRGGVTRSRVDKIHPSRLPLHRDYHNIA